MVEKQPVNATYYSENLEKHADFNNTCHITSEENLKLNHHPIIKYIYKKHLTYQDKQLLDLYVDLGRLKSDNEKYYVQNPEKEGFPRLFVNICDEQLDDVYKTKNKETYKYLNKIMDKHKFKNLIQYLEDINNIQVKDIIDEQPEKVACEKILGDNNDWDTPVMMYGDNKQTLFASAKRQMKTAPVPDEKVVNEFQQYAYKKIEEEIGEDLDHFSYDIAQWYTHLSYMKQQKIKEINDYYHPPPNYEMPDKYKLREIKTYEYTGILKKEIQDLDGKPRMVCSIPQRIKYIMGPVTWQLEEICADKLKGYCGSKNLTEMAKQINEYVDQGFTKVVQGDGSSFDNTQDICLKAIDRYIYNRIKDKVYHVPKKHFEKVANMHYKTMNIKIRDHKTGKLKNYIRYKVLGTVFSGDCDTTLANTIRMAMYNRFVNDKAGLRYGVDYVAFSKGDDFTILYKPYITDEFINNIYYKYFLQKGDNNKMDARQFGLGQIMKYLEIGGIESFRFCSLRSWIIDDNKQHITLTRDPSKLFTHARYAIKTKNYNMKQLYKYHIDLAKSYLINYKGIEIFTIMAMQHILKAHEIKKIGGFALTKKEKEMAKHMLRLEKLSDKCKQKERKLVFETTYVHEIDEMLKKLMEVRGRKAWMEFYGPNYWEEMKKVELIRNEELNINELKYINQQINLEFDTEELKSLIGCWAKNKN